MADRLARLRAAVSRNPRFFLGLLIVVLYYGYFVLPSLKGQFNADDPMNIYYFWSRGGWALLKNIALFFTSYYRPMGGLFFFLLYKCFGFTPLPYHIVIVLLLLIDVGLVYRCATQLSNSKVVGGFCAILLSYHARMPEIVYLPSFVFDVLCFTFYFSALSYYLQIRSSGRTLKARQILCLLLLYIASLESKEMAVSFPVMLLAYEWIWNRPVWSARTVWGWIRSAAIPIIATGLVTAIFIAGKLLGSDSLLNNKAYQPILTVPMFLNSNVRFLKELLYLKKSNSVWLILTWTFLAYIAYSRRRNYLKWATIMVIVAPIPIAFIPDRGGSCLYIVAFGWALWIATLAEVTCSYLSAEPLFGRLPRDWARGILLLAMVGLLWRHTDFQRHKTLQHFMNPAPAISSLMDQLKHILPVVKPGTQIAIYGNVDWDAKFIVELFYHDRSVEAHLNSKSPLTPDQVKKMDYVLMLQNDKISILKRR